ncbi:hypothetical protein [Corallococcus sp. Z5C101001]|uniref:hypothetical protein n=1 Tax=Corallococcus sp. Z5C101001 TaxID=2596829 RepID=UPI00117EE889|nr:hypothetical protein [Corallococcus sp. Z5C101001]TSC33831.1 hypothetical protein FOF48_01935 [Corallococcus sp. Z5C101001]
MPSRLLPWLLVLLCACSRPSLGRPARGELWVDGASAGGDGTRERPLRSLSEALARPGPLLVHLASGRYEGPFRLLSGTRLVGQGSSTVLRASDPGAAVVGARGEVGLEALTVEGGGWGLAGEGGALRIEGVIFRNQALGAIRLGAGSLDGRGLRFEARGAGPVRPEASCPESIGAAREPPTEPVLAVRQVRPREAPEPGGHGTLTAEEGAHPSTGASAPTVAVGVLVEAREGETSAPSLLLRDSTFAGAFERAVRGRGGATVHLAGVCFQGPRVALSQEGGVAEVERAWASGGTGTAFSTMAGTLKLVDVRVRGYEYGVATNQSRLSVRGFTSEHATRAGLGLTATRGLLEDVVVRDAGDYGALQLTNSDLEVRRFRLEGSREYGVVAVQGRVRLRDGVLTGVSTADGVAGDGLHLRQVEADVDTVTVHGAKGSCVLATQRARVTLRNARLSTCGLAALAVDTQATLESRNIEVRGTASAVLLAIEGGQLRVQDLTAREVQGELISADCEGRTRVQLRHVEASNTRGVSSPCVQLEPPARSP